MQHLQEHGLGSQEALWAGTLANIVSTVLPPFVGWLTDVKGVGWVTCVGAAAYAVASPLIYAFSFANPGNAMIAFIGLGFGYGTLLAFASATFHLYCAELFPTAVRATGLGVAYNIGQITF